MNIHQTIALTSFSLLITASGCKTLNERVAAGAPTYAADASIKLSPNKTGNGELLLEVEHLAPPKRIDASNAGYVAWIVVEGQPPVKLGVLEYNERKRRGELHATTPQKEFILQITIEKDLAGATPAGTMIINHPIKAKY